MKASTSVAGCLLTLLHFLTGCTGMQPKELAQWHYEFATELIRGKESAAAIESLRRAAQLDPGRDDVLSDLAKIYADTGKNQLALETLAAAIAIAPGRPDLHMRRAWLHANERDWPKVVAGTTRAIELLPGNPAAWRLRAIARVWTGDLASALHDARVSVQTGDALGTTHAEQLLFAGKLLLLHGEYAEAVKALQRSNHVGMDGGRGPLWLYVAERHAGNNGARAREQLQSSRSQLPATEWPVPLIDHALGERSLDDALAQMPEDDACTGALLAAEIRAVEGDRAEAERRFASALHTCTSGSLDARIAAAGLTRTRARAER